MFPTEFRAFFGEAGKTSAGFFWKSDGTFVYIQTPMVPPQVEINARYYGWRVALYIAAVMYVSIVCTALILHCSFAVLGLTPESVRAVKNVAQFKLNYTFWMNLIAAGLVGGLSWLNHSWHCYSRGEEMEMAF